MTPVTSSLDRLAEQARQSMRRHYAAGLRDGARLVFDHIEGRPDAPGVPYSGPLPDDLRTYITEARRRVEASTP
jgi:hypothetical protein